MEWDLAGRWNKTFSAPWPADPDLGGRPNPTTAHDHHLAPAPHLDFLPWRFVFFGEFPSPNAFFGRGRQVVRALSAGLQVMLCSFCRFGNQDD